MLNFIIRRLLYLIPTLLGVTILCFFIIRAIPGDPAQVIAGADANAEQVAQIRTQLGIEGSLFQQYINYLWGLLHGDMGNSLKSGQPVLLEIIDKLPTTIILTLLSVTVMIIIGIIAGVFSAMKPNSFGDNFFMLFALFGISMPIFWFGIALIWLFSYNFQVFPAGGDSGFMNFVLPAITLGFASSAILARLTRSSMLEVVNQDYVRTARAKGLKNNKVLFKHTFKNASITIITVIGLEFGNLLGGTVITETVFSMNGLGRYIIQAIQFRDYPAVQGSILFVAIAFVLVNLLVDLTYGIIDPRLREK